MCLQWCHVTERLIDNDLPCLWCAHFSPGAGAPERSCGSCIHRRERRGQRTFCGLSSADLPLRRACCHWNVQLTAGPQLQIGPGDVAPGLLEAWGAPSVAALFERSETAPDHRSVAGDVQVALSDLALPLVYGVPAHQWNDALDTPSEDLPPGPDLPASAVGRALLGLLDALEGPSQQASHDHAAQLLAWQPGSNLPAPWEALVAQALRLYSDYAPSPRREP